MCGETRIIHSRLARFLMGERRRVVATFQKSRKELFVDGVRCKELIIRYWLGCAAAFLFVAHYCTCSFYVVLGNGKVRYDCPCFSV